MKRNFGIFILLLMLTGLLSSASMSLAQGDKWIKKKDIPTARSELSASVVNGLIYVIGGWDGAQPLTTVEVYNSATNTWKQVADIPTARRRHSTSVVNGKIYVFGGFTTVERRGVKKQKTLSTVEEYDPATNTWAKKADMPSSRWALTTSALNGKIYAIGGATNVGGTTTLVEVYDPATDTWAKGTPLLDKRWALTSSVVNGKIYAFGGEDFGPQPFVEEYDPATDKWTRKKEMPAPRKWLAPTSPAAGGKIYVIGGQDGNQPVSIVEEYDPATDRWSKKRNMATARPSLVTVAVKGKIYAIAGGGEAAGQQSFVNVEEYTPEGWPFVVSPQGKLATAWGTIKAAH